MGKVKYIKQCRKEQKCNKCGSVIPVGGSYYKGELFRMRPIVRCAKCGLKHYEVTTSDYIQNVGRIAEDWQEDYAVEDGVWDSIAESLEEIKGECEERLENIPEQLRDADAGSTLQERIDTLESAIYELGNGSFDEFLRQAYDELDEEEQAVIDKEAEQRSGDYEDWFAEFCESGNEVAVTWKEAVDEAIISFIDDALSELSY